MTVREVDGLDAIAAAAIREVGVDSVAIFVVASGTADLELGAAAGIEGPHLDRLVEAVRAPTHPIARTMSAPIATFDVAPMAPGGPALRSHMPLMVDRAGGQVAVGVLAVAYEGALDATRRQLLMDLAARAARAIEASA